MELSSPQMLVERKIKWVEVQMTIYFQNKLPLDVDYVYRLHKMHKADKVE